MNKILLLIVLFVSLYSCGKQEIGYLDTANAAYIPDSVVFKAVLNPDDPEDARRIKFEIPFQSQTLQKLQGTLPIAYSIRRIDCNNHISDEVLKQFTMKGKGRIELPFNHTVPPGRYVFSLMVTNEGHSTTLDSMLTVILR